MTTISLSKKDLIQAMRDPRGWDGGHPEREAYGTWTREAWKTLGEAGALGGDDTVVVQVKGYHRTRNGKREWVRPYEQTRQAAEVENDNAAVVPVRAEVRERARARSSAPPEAGDPTPPRVATLFIGGGGDGKTGIVRNRAGFGLDPGFAQSFPEVLVEYFSWNERPAVEARIRALRAQNPGIRIHLVGHSYGGDTAAQIAAGMAGGPRPIDLLVTVDPVGRGTSSAFFERVRDGTWRWINVNATEGGKLESSNIIAGLGGAWNYGPMGHADSFLNVPATHANFAAMMRAELKDGRTIEQAAAGR